MQLTVQLQSRSKATTTYDCCIQPSNPLHVKPNLLPIRLLINTSNTSPNVFSVVASHPIKRPQQVLWLRPSSGISKPTTLVQFSPCQSHKNRLCTKPGDESSHAGLPSSTAVLSAHHAEANSFEIMPTWQIGIRSWKHRS